MDFSQITRELISVSVRNSIPVLTGTKNGVEVMVVHCIELNRNLKPFSEFIGGIENPYHWCTESSPVRGY